MSELILALAGAYGLSGSLFKVFRSIFYIPMRIRSKSVGSSARYFDHELSNIVTDVFAFSLFGTGFLLSILDISFSFELNVGALAVACLFQNFYVWFYGRTLSAVDRKGSTGHSLFFEGFSLSLIFYLAPWFMTAVFYDGTISAYAKLASLTLFLLPYSVGITTFYFLRELRGDPMAHKVWIGMIFVGLFGSLYFLFRLI